MSQERLTYREAGVDIHNAAAFVEDIGTLRARTERRRKLFQPFGLFAASYDLSGYKAPVLVTGCDGVGTKLELLLQYDLLETAGKDLVAMNVNDVITNGADPLVFLDYLGVPKVDRAQLARLVAGMVEWLESCDCILAGGETAEMPGLVKEGTVEMSGFCIGAVEKDELLDPASMKAGDVVVGFPSDGLHANGWSLARRVIREHKADFTEQEIIALLAPTRLYVTEARNLRRDAKVRAMAHITGGGLIENLQRLTKLAGCGADLQIPEWTLGAVPKLMEYVDDQDRLLTFNMGWGWAAVVPAEYVEAACAAGVGGRVLGVITPDAGHVRVTVSSQV